MAIPEIKKNLGEGRLKKPEKQPTPPPPKPKTLFEEKKVWPRKELSRRITKASPYIFGIGGAMYSRQERKKMVEKVWPSQRFKSHISETEAKKRLRELREEEYRAPASAKKKEIRRQRFFLERETGLKGKY